MRGFIMNETRAIEQALEVLFPLVETLPREVQIGLVGTTLLLFLAAKKREVVTIISHSESTIKKTVSDIYSFFNTKKIDRNTEMFTAAKEEYMQLVPAMSDELEPLLIAMIEKQQGKYDSEVVKLIQTLRVDLAEYPELPSGVMVADEVEQVIKARKEHHAKILVEITNYLESSSVDDSTQSYNIRKEI